jgi:hypothetical protein
MSAALREFVESLRRVETQTAGQHAWAVYCLTGPSEEETELAATYFANWLFERRWGNA